MGNNIVDQLQNAVHWIRRCMHPNYIWGML